MPPPISRGGSRRFISCKHGFGLEGKWGGKEHTIFDTPSTARSIKPNIRIVHVNLGVRVTHNRRIDETNVPDSGKKVPRCDREDRPTNRRTNCNETHSKPSTIFEPMSNDSRSRSKDATAAQLQSINLQLCNQIELALTPSTIPWQSKNCQYDLHSGIRKVAPTTSALETKNIERKYPKSKHRPTMSPGMKTRAYWMDPIHALLVV